MAKEVERVKDDRFSQCDRENSMDDNRRESPRIAADRCGHAQTGEPDADANPHRCEADVNAPSHFCK